MSDAGDWVDIPSPSPSAAIAPAAADDWTPVGAPAATAPDENGIFSRIGEDLSKRWGEGQQAASEYNSGKISAPEMLLRSTGKVAAGSANDVIGEGAKSAGHLLYDMAPDFHNSALSGVIDSSRSSFVNSDIGKAGIEAAKQGSEYYDNFAKQHPRAAANLESVINIGALMTGAKGGEAAAEVAKPAVSNVANAVKDASFKDFLAHEGSGGSDVIPTPKTAAAPKFDPADVHSSITDAYGKALGTSRQLYNNVREIGGGIDVPVEGLRDHLDSVIKEVSEDPLHEGKSALSDLKRIRSRIGETEPSKILDSEGNPMNRTLPDTVTANDLLDIKQFLNEDFNKKRFAERADNPYSNLSKAVKTGLSEVSDVHPPFGEALNTADKFWVNGVDLPYRSNDVLHRAWKPEDYHAQQSINRGLADTLPDATRERQYTLLNKIKNPIEFEAIRNALPKDAQQEFAQALGKYIKTDAGFTPSERLKNFVKGAYHVSDPTGLGWGKPRTGIGEITKALEPQFTDEQADIMKAISGEPYARGGAVNTKPTEAQKMAGNYKKHHIRFHGLDISIENPKGSERSGESRDGKKWSSIMPDHYGYIKRTQGADGDHIDVYVGENERSNRIYVIDQKDADTGKFDEHKCMLGYGNRDEAISAYRSAFSDKKDRIMKVTRMSISEFKDWLKKGNTKQAIKKTA